MSQTDVLPSSFRDPAGYVFRRDGEILRQVNAPFVAEYRQLFETGLYDALVSRNLLLSHEEIETTDDGSIVIRPQQLDYVSYPYEWSFSQFKAAAKLTLDVQKLSLDHGMSLKDASFFNLQFIGCKPVLIDTLSFAMLDPSRPWSAYRQFCEHFLGPLCLFSKLDLRLRKLLLGSVDGIPLDLVSKLLPGSSRFSYSVLSHIHLHARSQRKHAGQGRSTSAKIQMNEKLLRALIDSLYSAVDRCRLIEERTEWSNYYSETNYTDEAMEKKETLVEALLKKHIQGNELLHDIGANTGKFSRIAAGLARYVVSHDIDEIAVERNYRSLVRDSVSNILPLVLDVANPTPSIGWCEQERDSFLDRNGSHFVMALALIHHLAIGNNTPLARVSSFFARIASKLLIEFVPKEDSQVQRMLASREDIFPDYHAEGFEAAFSQNFRILEKCPIGSSVRTLYLLERFDDSNNG